MFQSGMSYYFGRLAANVNFCLHWVNEQVLMILLRLIGSNVGIFLHLVAYLMAS